MNRLLTYALWCLMYVIWRPYIFTEQNRTIQSVRLVEVRFCSEIVLTAKFLFDCVRLPNQSATNRTIDVRLSSIEFLFGFVRLATPGKIYLSVTSFRKKNYRRFFECRFHQYILSLLTSNGVI